MQFIKIKMLANFYFCLTLNKPKISTSLIVKKMCHVISIVLSLIILKHSIYYLYYMSVII